MFGFKYVQQKCTNGPIVRAPNQTRANASLRNPAKKAARLSRYGTARGRTICMVSSNSESFDGYGTSW